MPNLDALAAAAGMSRFHFHRVFKTLTGVTPKAYVAAHRAQRVRDEFSRSATVTEAIYGAGFNSNGRFYATSSEVQFVEDIFPMHYPAAQRLGEALGVSRTTAPLSVLDLAAGSGVWSIALAQQSPHVRVTAVDWAGVIPITRKVTARLGIAERFRFVEGDLLEADFENGHTIVTAGHILHSEGERRSRLLLKKAFDALAPGGTIAIAEILVDANRTGPLPALIFAVNMLVNSDEGDTFSFGEICGWLGDAGFENVRSVDAPGLAPLLILATKPSS